MDDAPPPADAAVPAAAPVVPFRATFRCTLLLFWGAVAPVGFLWAAAWYEPWDDVWQSGQMGDYALLLYRWPSLLLVYPFVGWGLAAMAKLAWNPAKHRGRVSVLLGVAIGALTWLELTVVWWPAVLREFNGPTAVGVIVLAPLAMPLAVLPWTFVARLAKPTSRAERIVHVILLALVILAWILVAAQARTAPYSAEDLLEPPFMYLLAVGVWSAPAALICYAWAIVECLTLRPERKLRVSLRGLLGLFTLLSAHLAAWRFAVNSMLRFYAETPVEQPSNCFVATAAARGRPGLVGSWPVALPGGGVTRVTRQLQRLKAFELVLVVTSPPLHRALRWGYNRVGPVLAWRLDSEGRADAAYLALKPAECLAGLVLRLAGVEDDAVARLYAGGTPTPQRSPQYQA